jgi:hypothetical protein
VKRLASANQDDPTAASAVRSAMEYLLCLSRTEIQTKSGVLSRNFWLQNVVSQKPC